MIYIATTVNGTRPLPVNAPRAASRTRRSRRRCPFLLVAHDRTRYQLPKKPKMSPNTFTLAAFAQGITYPGSNLVAATPIIQQSGWNTIIFGLFHIGRINHPPQIAGDIYFNDTLIISQGRYVGDPSWPNAISKLKGGSVTTLLASFGGAKGWVFDFTTIQSIYESNHNSFDGTNLQTNLAEFSRIFFPAITTIDMDNEDNYDVPSFVAFCEMLIKMAFTITFCPFERDDFWTGSLVQLEKNNPQAVLWWNLQCYAGGEPNDPKTWAAYIQTALPGFNIDRYILASDWTRFWDTNQQLWNGDCPATMQSWLARFKGDGDSCIGGAFIWTMDQIFIFANSSKQHPGSDCDSSGGSQTAYLNAMLGLKPS